jgi:uncharacterized protein (TIGR02996 family)
MARSWPRLTGELASLVAAIRDSPSDRALRLATADWLDEHLPPVPLKFPLPYFTLWWCRSRNHSRYKDLVGAPSLADSLSALERATDGAVMSRAGVAWLDHYGGMKIGRAPVLVAEPYCFSGDDEDSRLADCCEVLQSLLCCPTAFSRLSHWNPPNTKRVFLFYTE